MPEETLRPPAFDEWLYRTLASNGPESQSAQQELLRLLRVGLRRSLAARPEALEWVDDFAQEAATRVMRELPHFRGASRFSTWALAVAIRVAFDELRRRRWRDVSLDALLAVGAQVAARETQLQEKDLTRREILDLLRGAVIERLTERQRTALVAELKGMPQSELAQKLGVNRIALYELTHDARRQLKAVLSEKGITAETIAWAFEPL